MNFGKFIIYEIFFYLVIGQTINKEKSDCTKLYNFIFGDSYDYSNKCCSVRGKNKCNNGYITSLYISDTQVKIQDLTNFPYLSKLRELEIIDIGIKEIPNNILKSTTLESLAIIGTNIEEIPPTIQNLSQLQELYLNKNNIRELPSEIFKLKNLKYLYLNDNPNLDIKLISFGNSTIQNCSFNNITKISCYQSHTCESIQINGKEFSNAEAEKELKICTREEIDEVIKQIGNKKTKNIDDNKNDNINDLNQNNEKSKFPFIIILGCIVVILIGTFVTFMLIKKNKYKQNDKYSLSSDDEFETGSINVKLNNDNNNNINTSNINSNNINNNNNNNNNNTQNNLNQINLNSSIIVNSNSYNSSILPGRVVYINPQIPGNVIISNVIKDINNLSLSKKKSNIAMNFNNNDETVFYYTSDIDEDEPPPEYTEINKADSKQQFM